MPAVMRDFSPLAIGSFDDAFARLEGDVLAVKLEGRHSCRDDLRRFAYGWKPAIKAAVQCPRLGASSAHRKAQERPQRRVNRAKFSRGS
ncbi:hypothetical protein AKJ09_09170 [Labilithrix luteola]|uniref:Uncharacterized protein n=1 Tax=Labilithrix luteola TaxID=1391654 RepID=A0A0K1QA09_9BACT|nr:hypothetical protein AKJ09_09170 [Labilithrix luteola]